MKRRLDFTRWVWSCWPRERELRWVDDLRTKGKVNSLGWRLELRREMKREREREWREREVKERMRELWKWRRWEGGEEEVRLRRRTRAWI